MARLAGSLIAVFILAGMAAVVIARTWADATSESPITVPDSIASKHKILLSALYDVSNAGGETGRAAQQARKLIASHFEKEASLALPPLGALAPLSRGDLSDEMRSDVLRLSSNLEDELPGMLREHRLITRSLLHLVDAARVENRDDAVRLAQELIEDAQNEEEVIYPAAILVGEYLRAKEDADLQS
jgi:hypothetical protein